MRVVLDTNVLLAGIATHGICEGTIALSFRDHTVVHTWTQMPMKNSKLQREIDNFLATGDYVVFHHGSGKNLLVEPLRSYVDKWEDRYAPAVKLHSSKEGGIVRLEFSGRMATAESEAGPVSFRTTWRLSPYVVRADHQIKLDRDLQVSKVGVGSVGLRGDLDEYGLRTGPEGDPSPRKQVGVRVAKVEKGGATLIAEQHAPIYMLFFDHGDFWHDGDWPPDNEESMAGLRRVNATCHRHGIRVVPYFSMQEYHPDAVGYQEHEQDWKRIMDQTDTVFHNRRSTGEFGAQMCLLSGWLDKRKHDIETAYRELGFDGIYFDWMTALPCNHRGHRDGLHLGTDGVIDLLAWTRRLIGKEGILILHSSGWRPSITFENFRDLIVNMENLSMGEKMMRMEEGRI